MFKSVGLDVILLLVLIATLFATSKSIYEEIEDRTMLTLMSKPVQKWEVLRRQVPGHHPAGAAGGRVLGVILVLCTVVSASPATTSSALRTIDDRESRSICEYLRLMHIAGLIPSLVLMWLQISVLAAIGVALSTRFSLVVNLPTVILLYIAGNLTRFLFPLRARASPDERAGQARRRTVLPFLQTSTCGRTPSTGEITVAGHGSPTPAPERRAASARSGGTSASRRLRRRLRDFAPGGRAAALPDASWAAAKGRLISTRARELM